VSSTGMSFCPYKLAQSTNGLWPAAPAANSRKTRISSVLDFLDEKAD
jgi:hypothetical protein